MASNVGKAALQILPTFVYHMLAYTLILLGGYALVEDQHIVSDACGKQYHLFKFTALHEVLWVFACMSYCLWKGGGEGARARAMVLTILFSAFTVWGCLLWQELTPLCTEVFDKQFKVIYTFHHVATLMDGVTATMFFVHELWFGKYIGADLTIMADVHHRMNPIYIPERINMGAPGGDQGFHPQPMTAKSPPGTGGDLNPTLTYEYEKIMQNNTSSSSTLPQTTP